MAKYLLQGVQVSHQLSLLGRPKLLINVLQAASRVANPQNDVVQSSVPGAKGKPFHKSRLFALSALVWLPNRRSPNHTTSIGAIPHRPKQFRGIAHWFSWQSHWGNGIKDLLFEESTSPCGTSHPLNQCPFQYSKPKAWNMPQRNPKPDLEMHPTDYWCSGIQEHCQAHHIFEMFKAENKPTPTCLNHTIHKQSHKRGGLANHASRPQNTTAPSHWWLRLIKKKNPYYMSQISLHLFSRLISPTRRLIGHLSPGKVWW